ncbi:MAG TPA: hypothetical protein DFI00_07280 [Rhodospirillaceae bacterium]|nr:hypothetical protein [Alphaproteobacteria bacterium]OUT41545.1 MAG: hypothetical protein CBB62_04215 [Micavibrio sp. TMED2]HCI47079.1 hypothetical protein [Rhodospirillaceae bacterium]MAS46893.1 hypothetical protein [Alphaproteobacteria bacterium]MAX94988.1 hypothetical protein [Alphaproteobacteria bacterium]|tara:strand:- start:14004 stop:14312 length:309 start_codon:yes stop_codon:yes gene_type:complete
MTQSDLIVDLAITEKNQIVLYLEEPVPERLKSVVFHGSDGYVTLLFERRQPKITLEYPVDPDLRPAFHVAKRASVGHVTDKGTLTTEYTVGITLTDRPGGHH